MGMNINLRPGRLVACICLASEFEVRCYDIRSDAGLGIWPQSIARREVWTAHPVHVFVHFLSFKIKILDLCHSRIQILALCIRPQSKSYARDLGCMTGLSFEPKSNDPIVEHRANVDIIISVCVVICVSSDVDVDQMVGADGAL